MVRHSPRAPMKRVAIATTPMGYADKYAFLPSLFHTGQCFFFLPTHVYIGTDVGPPLNHHCVCVSRPYTRLHTIWALLSADFPSASNMASSCQQALAVASQLTVGGLFRPGAVGCHCAPGVSGTSGWLLQRRALVPKEIEQYMAHPSDEGVIVEFVDRGDGTALLQVLNRHLCITHKPCCSCPFQS